MGGAFVILVLDGFVELFAEGFADGEVFADLAFEDMELFDEGVVTGFFVFGVFVEACAAVGFDAFDAVADGIDGFVGFASFESHRGAGLGAVEEDEAAELFVRLDVILVAAVAFDEVHEREGVFGVEQGLVVLLEGEPGDASLVILDELAVGFETLGAFHGPGGCFGGGDESAVGGAVPEVVEVGGEAVGTDAVGPADALHLEDAEFDADLDDGATVAGTHFARRDLARMGFVGPAVECFVDIAPHS